MEKKIFKILRENKIGHAKAHYIKNELLILFGVTTRTFRFSGMNENVKFVVNVKANNRETAIAYFETEHPELTWRTTTEITDVS
jgi:hypothetical protein